MCTETGSGAGLVLTAEEIECHLPRFETLLDLVERRLGSAVPAAAARDAFVQLFPVPVAAASVRLVEAALLARRPHPPATAPAAPPTAASPPPPVPRESTPAPPPSPRPTKSPRRDSPLPAAAAPTPSPPSASRLTSPTNAPPRPLAPLAPGSGLNAFKARMVLAQRTLDERERVGEQVPRSLPAAKCPTEDEAPPPIAAPADGTPPPPPPPPQSPGPPAAASLPAEGPAGDGPPGYPPQSDPPQSPHPWEPVILDPKLGAVSAAPAPARQPKDPALEYWLLTALDPSEAPAWHRVQIKRQKGDMCDVMMHDTGVERTVHTGDVLTAEERDAALARPAPDAPVDDEFFNFLCFGDDV